MNGRQAPQKSRRLATSSDYKAERSSERGATIVETGISVGLVALIAVAATQSLGGGIQKTVNSVAQVINPVSGNEAAIPEGLSIGRPNLSLITAGDIASSKPALVPMDPPSGKPSGPMIIGRFGR